MPRAQANPDPRTETYTRNGVEYTITARRDGSYEIHRDGVRLAWERDPLHGFPNHRYPSNKRQDDAFERAKLRLVFPVQGDKF